MASSTFETPRFHPEAPPPPQYQQLLSDTAHLLLQDTDADTLCQTVFDILRKPLQLDVYFHYLVTEDGSHLELASSGGNDRVRAALGSPLQFGEAICGTVAQLCRPMDATHVLTSTDPKTFLIRSFGIRCYSCHPLVIHGHVVGTLSFGSLRRDEFRPDEIELFRLVTQQVTLATERRLQSSRLREMERLATVGRMSATLAHEINNPLESLGNILHLLRTEVHSADGEDLLEKAQSQVERLSETSHRTLDLFRGGRQRPQRVNVSELAHELLADIRLPQHTRVETRIEDGLCVNAIPGELRQVLFNLLINAAQFSPHGRPVTLSVQRAGSEVEVRVRDEGPGISAETRSHLFQPFYTTRHEGGTGVGLWVSREMVERAGGTLTFDSDPTTRPGTDFIARLPLVN